MCFSSEVYPKGHLSLGKEKSASHRVKGLEFRVRVRVYGLGFRLRGLEVWGSAFRFNVQSSDFRVQV